MTSRGRDMYVFICLLTYFPPPAGAWRAHADVIYIEIER